MVQDRDNAAMKIKESARPGRGVPMLRSLIITTATACARTSLHRPSGRSLSSSFLDRRDQASGPATRRRDAGAAHQVETLMLESQQLRRGVIIALVRAASDKEVAASPALQALRDQVIGLEHVQVLAE